jgi:L-ascorbate metabolism protein UlaG (beta-lactamase superfamily)
MAPTTGAVADGVSVTRIGGPTLLLEVDGVRLLTDPTFDEPGPHPVGDRVLTKLVPPSVRPFHLGRVDAVLLSHDQHPDNFDDEGRRVAEAAPVVLTTWVAAVRLGGNAHGLQPWVTATVQGAASASVRVTAVPAQHGPDGTEHLTGPVTGFVIEGASSVVYVSGDNAELRLVEEVAARFRRFDVAVIFGGAARTPLLGDANLTLDAAEMVQAARLLDAPRIVAAHVDGWAHFTETPDQVRQAFADAGLVVELP